MLLGRRLPRVEDIEKRIPRPEDFHARARGAETASRVGIVLGLAFGICFLTGMWSHVQYTSPGWLPIGPNPSWLYRVTQGLHVTSGVAAIPLLLVKLWSVFPRLFIRPPSTIGRALFIEILERGSIAVLMASAIFQLASGTLNIVQWYPWNFSFRATHEAVAWIAIGSILVHICVKLPVIREALGAPIEVREVPHDEDAPSRRAVLRSAGIASGLAVLLTAGQTVPFLRKVSVFGVRDGEGDQDLPINRTARAAGATEAAMDAGFVLELRYDGRTRSLSRADLSELPQRTHRLPIACVEGWSRNAIWTGVAISDLIGLVGAPADSAVKVRSMQTKGAFASSELPADFVSDPRTLLALELNGEALSIDHGYPCRIIAPNRPGVLQTKWVKQLEVIV